MGEGTYDQTDLTLEMNGDDEEMKDESENTEMATFDRGKGSREGGEESRASRASGLL